MTEEELKLCQEALNKIIDEEDLEFADNFRFARVGVEEEEMEYKHKADQGCCGYHDSVVNINGFDYQIGCNYGH